MEGFGDSTTDMCHRFGREDHQHHKELEDPLVIVIFVTLVFFVPRPWARLSCVPWARLSRVPWARLSLIGWFFDRDSWRRTHEIGR
jgi:hypothetical protein